MMKKSKALPFAVLVAVSSLTLASCGLLGGKEKDAATAQSEAISSAAAMAPETAMMPDADTDKEDVDISEEADVMDDALVGGADGLGAEKVVNASDLKPTYATDSGQLHLDLLELQPLSEPKAVAVTNGSGIINVVLPANVPVELVCNGNDGGISGCESGSYNPDAQGEKLTLTVTNGSGIVTVVPAE